MVMSGAKGEPIGDIKHVKNIAFFHVCCQNRLLPDAVTSDVDRNFGLHNASLLQARKTGRIYAAEMLRSIGSDHIVRELILRTMVFYKDSQPSEKP